MVDMETPRVFTSREAANWCGVNFRTVLRWIERGELNAYRLPGSRGDYRITLENLLEFLNKNQMPIPHELSVNKKRVLIVEDNPSDAKLCREVLDQAGFETELAQDGFAAGAKLTLFRPEVVTLDLNMPGLPGIEVIKMIRNIKQLDRTKILVVSAMEEKQLKEALVAGANDILQKPISYKKLTEKVTALSGFGSKEIK